MSDGTWCLVNVNLLTYFRNVSKCWVVTTMKKLHINDKEIIQSIKNKNEKKKKYDKSSERKQYLMV